MDQLQSYSLTSKTYQYITNCLRKTAEEHGTTLIEVLLMLEGMDSYQGIRKWYLRLRKKFAPPPPLPEEPDRQEAEYLLHTFSVYVTGARSGDILLGLRTQSKDAVFRWTGALITPSTSNLSQIRSFPDLWDRFVIQLGSIRFFGGLTPFEREVYLEEIQTEDDIYIDEIPDGRIDLLQLGSSDFLKLSEDDINHLLGSNPLPGMEIRSMFPRKPGSKGIRGRQTLIFRRSIWTISTIRHEVDSFSGPTINLVTGDFLSGGITVEDDSTILVYPFPSGYKSKGRGKSFRFIPEGKSNVGFLIPMRGITVDQSLVDSIISRIFHSDDLENQISLIRGSFYKFPPSAHKSLIQKIVRFRPQTIDLSLHLPGEAESDSFIVPAELVLYLSLGELLSSPGSFVPDIQRYVTGLESGLKRLVVVLCEDSYFSKKDAGKIVSLLAGAFLVQRDRSWKPPQSLLETAFEMARKGYRYDKTFLWKTAEGMKMDPYVVSSDSTQLQLVSALIDELKSFQGDLGMIRYIVGKWEEESLETITSDLFPEVMPIYHCVDQHWAPEVLYFLPPSLIEANAIAGSKPYADLLERIFGEITGVNSRRERIYHQHIHQSYTADFEERDFVQVVRQAQRLVLVSRQINPSTRTSIPDSGFRLDFELDRSWIAGLLGPIEARGRGYIALVTLRPDVPEQLVAIRKPSRDIKKPLLSPEQEERAIATVRQRLLATAGLPLNKANPPIPQLKGAKLIRREDPVSEDIVYWIRPKAGSFSGPSLVKWDDFRFSSEEIPYLEPIPFSLLNCLLYTSDRGTVPDHFAALDDLLRHTPDSTMQRAITYLSGFSHFLELNRIGRDGGGSQQAVVIEDISAYQFILHLSLLFPGALKRVPYQSLKFEVPLGPLMWEIRDRIGRYLVRELDDTSEVEIEGWPDIFDNLDREVWRHQTEVVEEVIHQHQLGRRGHFIWVPVGLGKTLAVFMYLQYLQEQGQLPKYIIYTLPSSAIQNIIHEAEAMNFDIRLMVPLKSIKKYEDYGDIVNKGCNPLPYTINLIEHDHLRRCEGLEHLAPDSIFIIDEVHKALNETKRTAIALQLSHLSREFIALTGTPIIDSHTYKLIWWLEQIVPFEVNERNFWVAANGMVAKKVTTGIKVNFVETLTSFTPKEEDHYQSLVPPKLGGRNGQATHHDIREAIDVCYQAATRKMIKLTVGFLKKGRGVMLVAKDVTHQQVLKKALLRRKVPAKDIFLIEKGKSIFLTDEAVESGKVPDYRVVITTKNKSEGYTLTRLNVMITSVYPSNNAVREQLEGRINRIGQKAPTVDYRIVHCGILTYIMQQHNDARNLSAVLSALADEIDTRDVSI